MPHTEDLYNIVSTANKSVESATKQFYGEELAKRGVPLAEPPVPVGGAAASGLSTSAAPVPAAVEAWRKTVQDVPGPYNGNGDVVMREPAKLAQVGA